MSNDPVSFLGHLNSTQGVQGFNRYAYVNNNPYKYVDPDGRAGEFAAFRLVAAGVAIDAATPDPSDAAAPVKAAGYAGALIGTAIGGTISLAINAVFNESSDSSSTENKGQGQAEVGDCSTCGGETSKKPGKIGKAHDLKPKEVRDRIHGVKNGQLTGNPDVEVCNDCGEVFPQTGEGLGDSIGNILDE